MHAGSTIWRQFTSGRVYLAVPTSVTFGLKKRHLGGQGGLSQASQGALLEQSGELSSCKKGTEAWGFQRTLACRNGGVPYGAVRSLAERRAIHFG